MRQVLSTIGVTLLFIGVLSDAPYRNGFGTTVFIAAAPPPAQSRSLTPRQKKLFPPQDLGLLSAPDRDDWNKPDLIMDVLGIADGAVEALPLIRSVPSRFIISIEQPYFLRTKRPITSMSRPVP